MVFLYSAELLLSSMTTVIPIYAGKSIYQPFDIIENGGWLDTSGGRAAAFFCSMAWAIGNMYVSDSVTVRECSVLLTMIGKQDNCALFPLYRFLILDYGTDLCRRDSQNITANSISAANDLASLFPKWVDIRRGQIFVLIVGCFAFAFVHSISHSVDELDLTFHTSTVPGRYWPQRRLSCLSWLLMPSF